MIKTKFCIDDSKVFEGYTEGETWNGWECPYFSLEEGKEVIKMIVDSETSASYDEILDIFIVVFNAASNDPDIEIYKSMVIEYEGENLKVYSIGSHSWCWDIAD